MTAGPDNKDALLWAYVEGQLPPDKQAELRQWLNERPERAARLYALADERLCLQELFARESAARQPTKKRSLRLWPTLSAAAALLAALGIGLWLSQTGPDPIVAQGIVARVESVQGTAFGFADATATEPRPLRPGDDILFGMRIETGPDSAATLAWLDNTARLALAESSVLSMPAGVPSVPVRASSVSLQKHMVLHQGALTATVAPQPAEQPFAVETPHALATVLGTRFRLNVKRTSNIQQGTSNVQGESTWLSVEDGQVRFTRLADQESVVVAAGEFAVAGEDLPLKAYPADTEWIEGRILFEDDFRDGFKNWTPNSLRVDGDNMVRKSSSIVDGISFGSGPWVGSGLTDDGRALTGIEMRVEKNAERWALISLKENVFQATPAYSVEFRYRTLTAYGGAEAGPYYGHVQAMQRLSSSDPKPTRTRKPFLLNTYRYSVTPSDDDDYASFLKTELDGKPHMKARATLQHGYVGFSVQKGQVFLYRCVVRELVPVPTLQPSAEGASIPRNMTTDGLLALYLFNEGQGNTIYDVSGIGEPMNLTIRNPTNIEWLPGRLRVNNPANITADPNNRELAHAMSEKKAASVVVWAKFHEVSRTHSVLFMRNVIGRWSLTWTQTRRPGKAEAPVHLAYVLGEDENGFGMRFFTNGTMDAFQPLADDSAFRQLAKSRFELLFAPDSDEIIRKQGHQAWRGDILLLAIYDRALSPEEIAESARSLPTSFSSSK